MSQRAAEFLVIFFVKLAAVLVERHKSNLKTEESQKLFEEKIESASTARARQDKTAAAKSISESFDK